MSLVQESLTRPVVPRAVKGTGRIEGERLAESVFSSAWHQFPSNLSHTFKKTAKGRLCYCGEGKNFGIKKELDSNLGYFIDN